VYLLSHAFWKYIEKSDKQLSAAAAGFLRSYSYLIQYEQDFIKAQDSSLRLIPSHDGNNPITYEQFANFIAPFSALGDHQVSSRYHYGELRLSRLNLLAPLLFRKLVFHHINGQWSSILPSLFAWSLVAFIGMGTILAAMQVELAVQSLSSSLEGWTKFALMCRWTSVVMLMSIAIVLTMFIGTLLFLFIHDIYFAQSILRRKKSQKTKTEGYKSGVV
jgi:hypothetical protein